MKIQKFAAAAALVCAGSAVAGTELFIDINTITVDAGGAFGGLTHTGSLVLSGNVLSTLAGVRIDGATQTLTSSLLSFSGRIDLVGGGVTGGRVDILNVDGSTYGADILGGVGSVAVQSGQGWSIDGLTFNGLFGSTNFAGVNVTDWYASQPRPGSVINFAFSPNGAGVDTNSDVDLYVLVPMPQAAGLGLAGLAGLGLRRRR